MKKLLTVIAALWLVNSVTGQESVGPIMRKNLGKGDSGIAVRATGTFDSTFHYVTDTLTLPLFDDFSLSHFQSYDAQITDPNVTEELFYQLTTTVDVPLPANSLFTTTATYKRTVSVAAGTSTDATWPATQVRRWNLAVYPPAFTLVNLYPPYNVIDTIDFPNDQDTIDIVDPLLLVAQDSARIFHVALNDPSSFWLDSYAYHNYTMAINPWSLGVVTFDGLDENGFPYNFGSTTSGIADFLTSKPLDLSGMLPSDNVYMSFLVQPQGYGEVPEANDSLMLEFYDVDADNWNYVWGLKGGGANDKFTVVHFPVTQAIYLKKGFRFRFKNQGGLSGSLDHFHIDYVYLRENSGVNDSIFEDFAWVYPVGSLIKDYTSVPWDHWKNNSAGKMNDETHVTVRNTDYVDKNPQISQVTVKHNGVPEHVFTMTNLDMTTPNPNQNYDSMTSYSTYHDFSSGYTFDVTVPGDEASFDIVGLATIQQPTYAQNDTCYATQYFGDYYSYDDGTAEKAYGITGVQARLAYKFTSYEPDSLLGVRMHFVPSVNDVSDKLFLLTVWGDNNGIPGTVLYQDEFFYPRTPVYEEGRNGFTDYYLADTMKLPVSGTFYVGWRQIDADRLNIGFDMNNQNQDKIFYSLNGAASWTQSGIAGSMMMRPVFSTASNVDLAVEERAAEVLSWEVYPNPSTGMISIDWKNDTSFPGAVCRDAQGRIIRVLEANEQQLKMDLSDVPAGIYFVELSGLNRQVKKVVRY